MTGELNGDPISSSGFATNVTRRSLAGLLQRRDRMQAGQEPRLHVGHAGPERLPALGPIRPLRGRPGIEDGVHVADEQQSRSIAVQAADDEVAELRSLALGLVAAALDRRTEGSKRFGHVVGDPVHAVRRVRAAVDVHELLQLG